MLDAARTAVESAATRVREDLAYDPVWAFGIVKLLEIIGEAASRITEDVRLRLSEIPWPAMVGMRNRLVHAYFDIDHEQVWKTVEQDLPALIATLQEYLDHPRPPTSPA
ncbi:MAG: DUF86 domain-containing protein [Acidobacteria bacterium]|nr:DUF86 domain-containing protein [Acidobacteriota bacterium]